MAARGTIETRVEIIGADKLVKDLILTGVDRKTIAAANKKAGQIVLDHALANAKFKYGKDYKHAYPHQKGTGRLLKSLRVYNRGASVSVGSRLPYANPIHWGWFYDRNNFVKKRIKPNPFLARALGYNRQEILDTYKRNLQKLIAENGK
jgi:phage gpG-like protein